MSTALTQIEIGKVLIVLNDPDINYFEEKLRPENEDFPKFNYIVPTELSMIIFLRR